MRPSVESIAVGEIRLAVRVWNCPLPSRPPAVLLHGTGESARDWDVVAADLGSDRRVYAVDLRGHGRSDWPGTYSIRLMADDVAGLLASLGGQVDLLGHSLGGLVACLVAAGDPTAVRRLVLEDVPVPHPRPASMPTRPDADLEFDWRVVEQVRPEIDDPDPGWSDVVARITSPALDIGGGPSSTVPQDHVAELVRTLPRGRLVTIDAGHLVHATKPSEFLAEARAFLDAEAVGR